MSASLALILASALTADLDAIDRAVARFTGTPVGQEGGAVLPVDRRLRLRPCSSPPVLSWRTARQDSVVVECPDIGGWRLFVPVRPLRAAAPALPEMLVNRGDAVAMAVSGRGFTVSQPGEALESGAAGDWIRVRRAGNPRATPLRARVVRPGLVELALP